MSAKTANSLRCSILFSFLKFSLTLDNGQALTPPMGWLSWERFRCNIDCKNDPDNCISETLIRQMADRLAGDGFLKAGYNIIGIDDCWLAKIRDAEGKLQPDPSRFPSGIKALADYVHRRGLRFGIYGDIGQNTCGGYPGMAGNLELDARTYADWGVDYLKVDGCYADPKDFAQLYPLLGHFLNQTGRPITYSCSWPAYLPDPVQTSFPVPYKELARHCNLWRNWVDIQDSWDSLAAILTFWAEASKCSAGFQEAAGPGAWNDADMLIIGNKGLTKDQSFIQMGMWAIFASPMLMSVDLRNLGSSAKDLLLNKALITINQDPLGIQGVLVDCQGGCNATQLWYRVLSGGARAAAFLNLSSRPVGKLCLEFPGARGLRDSAMKVSDVFGPTRDEMRGNVSIRGNVGIICVDGLEPISIKMFYVSRDKQLLPAMS